MEMSTDLNNGKPVVSCNWTMKTKGYQPDIVDQLLAYTDNPALEKVRTRPPGQHPFSEKEVRWMKERLDTCTQMHPICKQARAEAEFFEKPKFLLDIGSDDNTDTRLVESSNSRAIKYAILSYCWGQGSSKTYMTTSDNLSARLARLDLHELPKTIRDAVTVTRALGIRYLWVDALCIEQNLSRSEKREVLRNMPEIYAGAAIVIGAGSASHCNEGFLGRRNLQYHVYELQVSRTNGLVITNDKVRLVERGFEVKLDPLYTRVWTYQEGEAALFSLAFDTEKLVWKCQQSHRADSDIGLLSDPYEGNETMTFFDLLMGSREEVCSSSLDLCISKYIEMCSDYSRRQCGNLDDKLMAFSWAIDLMAKATRWDISECKAALWERDMPRQLLFCRRAAEKSSIETSSDRQNTREKTMIPSWSWTSKRTPVRWKDLNDRDHGKDYTAEYVACDIVPADVSDPSGAITGKQLTLRGNVRTALWNGLAFMTYDVSQAGRKLTSRQRSQSPTDRLADASQKGGGGDTKRKPVLATSSYRRRDPPLSRLTVDVTWDCLLEPGYQRVKLLELRCTFIKPVYYSFGIILTCNRRGTSERLGYFRFKNAAGMNWFQERDKSIIRIV
ncbi:hypothetical protein CGCS363_v006297 [Colletotrichum siamense]|uniref:uncharacterized protein n=1 Tax=Colletotrichum siamense TaxID=690259 RepID=UPI001872C419|nr:uncharacterized protein CGCS363_v006297 [Colletotrichum siamense]KAF5500672.1 hypothetical protein CGCS363_v006297 [Colletotrichum siamense]